MKIFLFKELHDEQEYYCPTMYRAGATVVSTITSCIEHMMSCWSYYFDDKRERLPFVLKTRNFRGGIQMERFTSVEIFRIKEIPFEELPFSRFYRKK